MRPAQTARFGPTSEPDGGSGGTAAATTRAPSSSGNAEVRQRRRRDRQASAEAAARGGGGGEGSDRQASAEEGAPGVCVWGGGAVAKPRQRWQHPGGARTPRPAEAAGTRRGWGWRERQNPQRRQATEGPRTPRPNRGGGGNDQRPGDSVPHTRRPLPRTITRTRGPAPPHPLPRLGTPHHSAQDHQQQGN
ncbi:pro-resilin-like [Dromiciops gliroides]|uniref:pro-resilin-like n=1 Tax=Dromiciops gliroides TaxID=33562 RepID=UPI001CC5B947|nr:pro-resilin-like [Dromiciops gliroides]